MQISLRWARWCLVLGVLLFAASNGMAKQPNFVVILTDDQGWGDLSLNGNKNLSTPNIDSLARDGAMFDRFYVCPVCSPTRAEFLTGRYHVRGGVYSTSAGGERLDLDETTIADILKTAGYRTGAFGKWHNGMQYPYHPNGRGFDEYYGFCSGHWGDYFSPPLEHNGKIVQGQGFCVDDFTSKAMDFIEANKDQPFFCYIPYNTPHSPMQVPERFWNKFKDMDLEFQHREPRREDVGHTRAALAMCENIDWNVGRLLKKLKDLKLEEDTVVVYFCDNGPNGWRWNGGMKGKKGATDEGGVRSPLLMRWPGQIKAGMTVKPISSATDLLPTFCDLAGVPAKTAKPLDGLSLKPLLMGGDSGWKDRVIISNWKNKISARNQRFRMDTQGKLYDMVNDPGQFDDVSGAFPSVTQKLRKALSDYRKGPLAELGKDERAFVVGHPDFKYTQIPARDALVVGDNIKRSNKFPNCSYFTNWVSLEDALYWDVEVPETGEFKVEMEYACSKGDEGMVMELSFNGNRLSKRITRSHEVPARGMENDRVERVESYVKDFRTIEMGTLQLTHGKGRLELKALEIPGKAAIEFRLLMLERK